MQYVETALIVTDIRINLKNKVQFLVNILQNNFSIIFKHSEFLMTLSENFIISLINRLLLRLGN